MRTVLIGHLGKLRNGTKHDSRAWTRDAVVQIALQRKRHWVLVSCQHCSIFSACFPAKLCVYYLAHTMLPVLVIVAVLVSLRFGMPFEKFASEICASYRFGVEL